MLYALDSVRLVTFQTLAQEGCRLTPRLLRTLSRSAVGLFCLALPTSIFAQQITIAWDPIPDPSLAGYRLYYGHTKGNYEGVLDVGMETTYTLTDLEEDRSYYFALVAYDVYGAESELSKEVAHNAPPTDAAEETDEGGVTDQHDTDEAESGHEPVLEASGEVEAEALDPMPILDQGSERDQDRAREEAKSQLQAIPQTELRIISVDSETLVGAGAAESAIDGRADTFWQTAMGTRVSLHPHEVVIDLGGAYMVRGFRYLPRQDGKSDGMVGRYSFYVSENGQDWGPAVIMGRFSREKNAQVVTFSGKMGNFVRFVAHSEVNGKPWTTVAEINVLVVH